VAPTGLRAEEPAEPRDGPVLDIAAQLRGRWSP